MMKTMKTKMIAMILALAAVLSTLTTPALAAEKKTAFSDVPAGHWAEEAIAVVSEGGLMKGYGDGRFGTDDTVSVDQLMMVLSRVKGLETVEKNGYWAYQAVENALNNDWGFKKDTIMPHVYGVYCSRTEAFTAMVRAFDERLTESVDIEPGDIPDFNQIESAYQADILKAYRAGLTTGVDSTRAFKPWSSLTRAQLAVILNRLGLSKAVAYIPEEGAVSCTICGSKSDAAHYSARGKDVVLCTAHYDDLAKAAQCAVPLMKEMGQYYESYGLADVTGDGIPEVFENEGTAIYHWSHGYNNYGRYYHSLVVTDIWYDSAKQQILFVIGGSDYAFGTLMYDLCVWTKRGIEDVETGVSTVNEPDPAVEQRIEELKAQMTPMTYDCTISESADEILLDMIATLG